MNFYYDLVLGLKYDYLGELFIVDLECLPQNIEFDVKQWLKYFKEMNLKLLDASSTPCCEIVGRITTYIL